MGKLTNNLVYQRLAPGVSKELKKLSPANSKGNRKTKLFQGLTPDVGHPRSRGYSAGVTTAIKWQNSKGWDGRSFLGLLEKTHPKYKEMPLFDDQD